MPASSFARFESRRPSLSDAEDAYEDRIVPFIRRDLRHLDDSPFGESRTDTFDDAPASPRRRRARRPVRQGNALAPYRNPIVFGSVAVGLLGAAFGIVQLVGRAPERSPEQTPVDVGGAPAVGQAIDLPASKNAAPGLAAVESATAIREPRLSVRTLEPNYTVVAGDTLVVIAARFSTSVQRIQALNELADPRVLSVGQKLVIPPSLPSSS